MKFILVRTKAPLEKVWNNYIFAAVKCTVQFVYYTETISQIVQCRFNEILYT